MGTRYDPSRSYRWNYDHPPEFPVVDVPSMAGQWTFLGRPVASPLGIAAGPLLNSAWLRYYAALGFDILTYKTVRSQARECYPLPNLVPVSVPALERPGVTIDAADRLTDTWAVSYGMPSMPPDVWRRDVEKARRGLRADQVLVVSVVGTLSDGMDLDGLADDYAVCAAWAVDSGADAVEANLSCPNVATPDGQLFQQAEDAGIVAEAIRNRIGSAPLLLKVGYFEDAAGMDALIAHTADHVDAYVMTNSIAAYVRRTNGAMEFDGQRRGICGRAIRDASVQQVGRFANVLRSQGYSSQIIGVGGISTWEDAEAYLQAGAEAVELATAAMLDPLVGIRIREAYAAGPTTGRAC